MRKVLSLLILMALLLTTATPALAQDGSAPAEPGDGDAAWHAYLPLVSGSAAGDVVDTPAEPTPVPNPQATPPPNQAPNRVSQADRQAAANRAAALGMRPVVTAAQLAAQMAASQATMGAIPHYYGPFPNYANSPLPTVGGAVIAVGNPLVERANATDYAVPVGELGPVFVVVPTALPAGLVKSFQIFNQTAPGSSPTGSAGSVFHAYVLRPTGTNQYTVVYDSGLLTVPTPTNPAGEVATFPVPDIAVQAGDVLGFYGQGIPVDVDTGSDVMAYPAPVPPTLSQAITLGEGDFPIYPQARAYSFGAQVLDMSGQNTVIVGGIRKFVDALPGLGPTGANNLGQYIPVAQADTTTYAGSDYYEIGLVQYEERMHSDLPATTLRGYVQLSTAVTPGSRTPLFNPDGSPILLPNGTQAVGVDKPHYLGPVILATKDKPVRILFRNLLPTGAGGDLFIPVDTTVMGSGMGPAMGGMAEMDPQNPMCGMTPKPMGCYSENRGTLHLHGGITPWISDGTPHQWITPAGENTSYPEGVSVQNVPDMPDPGPGAQTFFYTNQQSARLMFYHDHAWGITRLNVYAGEAAGYLISDAAEQSLLNNGLIPTDQIPLIIQDKTFVPPTEQLMAQDPTWDMSRWGSFGDLWVPHVYMPAQNPGDSSGVNQFGRWAYGPWFWPPTTNLLYGPAANPHYDVNCDPDVTWCEPPLIPGVPSISMGMEAFNDTPLVNGTAYPVLTVDPKSYRFRILNAANDRFFNLSIYKADPAAATEVQLNPQELAAALEDPTIFPTPVSGTEGPDWIQIGTEGGFLPAPVVIPAHPTTWVTDPTVFNAGNVDQHSLLLGPAERADVIVDFSQFAGQTLILYNDAPAAFPARDPRYDYYTGNADLRETGGAPSTLPGYGPNTRTVMQIKVNAAAPAPTFNLAALQAAFTHKTDGSGVFESSQHPIIVGQGAYNSAYGTAFKTNGPRAGLVQIFDTQFSFDTLSGVPLTMPLQPKMIQDEMGEAFEKEYGRMSGFLGLEAPNANAGAQNMILYPYVNPVSEILDAIELPPGVKLTPIASATDGTQIWKITHNGVDTHPIHFHLTDVQLINRVGWDGIIRRPDANELGWKDTVRVSPLEDTIIAMRPVLPKAPFGVPDSVRPLNPMMPIGDASMFNNVDANGNPITPPITNQVVNFGWEYVWHCHILSHEEMDMMRPITALAARALPAAPVLSSSGAPGSSVNLAWTDGTPVTSDWMSWGDPAAEVGYRIERALGDGPFAAIGQALANVTAFSDGSTAAGSGYRYRVAAYNAAGESVSNIVLVGNMGPAAPTNLQAQLVVGPRVNLTWADNANNETNYIVQRSTSGGAFATVATLAANTTTWSEALQANRTYAYRVYATNAAGRSPDSNQVSVTTGTAPAAPSNLAAQVQNTTNVRLTFRDNSNNDTGFMVARRVGTGAWQQIAILPAQAGTGSTVTYVDTVATGQTYGYQVFAINNGTPSSGSNTVSVNVPGAPVAPAAPANFTGVGQLVGTTTRINFQWTDLSNNETRFVIQAGGNAGFTGQTASYTMAANATTWQQSNLPRGATVYYRIRAENATGVSAWVNMTPFPIVTP